MARMKLAVCFQFTYIGMPMIYYGDEIGMTGETDPDCRRPMIWDSALQNENLLELYRVLCRLRKQYPALTRGSFRIWFVDEALNAFGFIRTYKDERIAVLINHSPNPLVLKLQIPWSAAVGSWTNILNDTQYNLDETGEQLYMEVEALDCSILIESAKDAISVAN
jgi:cyclomaltodextrinase